VIRYLLIVYGLGPLWLYLVLGARGAVAVWLGVFLVLATFVLFACARRRADRMRSAHEGIGGRLITHVGMGMSRWDRRRGERPDDFEINVGGDL